MVLWKKESVAADAVYVNLLPHKEISDSTFKILMTTLEPGEKNDKTATEFRNSGNEQFRLNRWPAAMQLYNKCLRFALIGSENIAFAYANRSMCFLQLRMYNECLADIKLAKEDNYPERLLPKLDRREAECLNRLYLIGNRRPRPVLSFDPDENFPCLANVLEIRSNHEIGKHIVAECDLEVGQVVTMEESFVMDATHFFKTSCKTCHQFDTNFIACPNCADVMFCNENCMEANRNHRIACGSPYHRILGITAILDSALVAVSAFTNIEDFERFVANALKSRDSTDSPICTSTVQSNYCLFLQLPVLSEKYDEAAVNKCFMTYEVFLKIPEMNRRFDDLAKRRFLMHLVMQHTLILDKNSDIYVGADPDNYIYHINIVSSTFRHSCVPNVSMARCGNRIAGYIVRPIQAGEEVFVRYTEPDKTNHDLREYQIDCKCTKCVPCSKQEDRIEMQSNLGYQSIIRYDTNIMTNDFLRPMMMIECRDFLNKYGRLPWSEEIEAVLNQYKTCMNIEFTG